MSAKAANAAKQKLHVDAESRALMENPAFRQILEAGRTSAAEGLLTSEELDRQRPITPEEAAEADQRIARLEAEDEAAAAARRNGAPRR